MSRIAFVALLLIPSLAAAQAPGEEAPVEEAPVVEAAVEVAPQPTAPAMAPLHGPYAAVVVAPALKPVELSRRFGVAVRMVSLGLTDGTTESEYAGGGIAASYRINKRWELVLALDSLEAPEGPALHSTSLEARFHLTPYRKWDWYALVGIGALHEVPLEGADDEGMSRGRVHAGIGLARRFHAWSIGAELHSVGVGPREQAMDTSRKASTPMTTDDGLTGGELTVSASLFF